MPAPLRAFIDFIKASANLAEFFAESPLRGSGLKARRRKDGAREVDL